MRFASVCLVTRDVSALAEYYRVVLGIEPAGSDEFTFFATPGAGLALYTVAGAEAMAPGCMDGAGNGGCFLEFEVDDVDAEYERLAALGLEVVKPPATYPWGRRSFWLRDPEGNIVNLNAPSG